MGQAKRRGTYEERLTQAMAKQFPTGEVKNYGEKNLTIADTDYGINFKFKAPKHRQLNAFYIYSPTTIENMRKHNQSKGYTDMRKPQELLIGKLIPEWVAMIEGRIQIMDTDEDTGKLNIAKNLGLGLMSCHLFETAAPYPGLTNCVYTIDMEMFENGDLKINGCVLGRDTQQFCLIQKGIKKFADEHISTFHTVARIA